MLKLATGNASDATWPQEVIERTVSEATQFKAVAKGYPIRPATQTEIAKAISENGARMT